MKQWTRTIVIVVVAVGPASNGLAGGRTAEHVRRVVGALSLHRVLSSTFSAVGVNAVPCHARARCFAHAVVVVFVVVVG